MVRSFCSAPAVLKKLRSWYRKVGKKGQEEAENAPVVGDFPARTDDARSARASDVEDATVQRARGATACVAATPRADEWARCTWVSSCQTKIAIRKGRESEKEY